MNSERNSVINEVNWNILVTSGKEIKRDSMISVNESRAAYINISTHIFIFLNYNKKILICVVIDYKNTTLFMYLNNRCSYSL